MTENILELRNISKRFGNVEVLHQVSFALKAGEVHALLGENGAGKSTLIKIVTGVHQPDGGQILVNGRPVQFADALEARQAGIAAIYQELSLFPDLDVAENIFVGRQPTRRGGAIDWRRLYREAGRLVASLGVHLDLKAKARQLSIAQQQTVEIARAFSISARILIMDEPTSSLALNEVMDLFRLVRRLRAGGTSVIFISHRIEELFELADRVTVLRDGAFIDTRPMREVSREDLIRMMVGRTIAALYPKQTSRPGKVMLKVDHLSRAGVFEGVSFELRAGEILGMAGLVGAGRTEVARTIFGIAPASSGAITVRGQPESVTSPEMAIRLGIAYVPEDRQLHGIIAPMSIIANTTLPLLNHFARWGWLLDKAERTATLRAARQMEVRAKHISQRVGELSGGNQQKVLLARWLATEPSILILDEPTRGIDVGTKAAVHALMNNLAMEGMAILMISSELPEILGMSDRILVMREGQVTGLLSRAEATQEKVLHLATQSNQSGEVQ